MELKNLTEASKRVDTETGWAKLNPDGSMVVDNSGYRQHLTPEQVKAAWRGDRFLPLSPDEIESMREEGATDQEMLDYRPEKDRMYDWYNWTDECHTIPPKRAFK